MRPIFSAMLFAITSVVAGLTGMPGAVAEQPNIVFVFSDDHAWQALSAYGTGRFPFETPQLDRLAREGMRFDRCLVTNSICGPSRAVILSGRYSHLNGFRQNGDRFDGSQTTFPKLLQAAGYQTAVFGKWHLGSQPVGFDEWEILPGQGHYYNPDLISAAGTRRVEGYVTDIVTDRALEWLQQQRDADRPFMLMVQHKAPHREWMPGPQQLDDLRQAEFPDPPTLFDDYRNRAPVLAEQEMTIARHMRDGPDLKLWRDEDRGSNAWNNHMGRLTDAQRAAWEAAYAAENNELLAAEESLTAKDLVRWKFRRYLGDYLRCVKSIDDNTGRLLDWLESSGLASSTIVVYSSDQGFYLGEHGWYDKRWIFEESLRTPLLVRWPGEVDAESVSKRIVSNLDFAPTFLEMAGVDIPAEMQGRSLVPLLRGEEPADWREDFYYHYYELGTHNVAAHYGIVTDRYKLVHYYARLDADRQREEIDQRELMDLEVDPLETRSWYDDPQYASVRQRLERRLAEMRNELAVPEGE